MSSFKFFFNPKAKSGKNKKLIPYIDNLLSETNIEFELEYTLGPRKGIKQAEGAKDQGFGTVIAMGGDGTVSEIANGAINTKLNFGVIPIGSGNDFASGIGIDSWKTGVNAMIEGSFHPISILNAGDYHPVNIIDAGLGADAVKLSETKLKWLSGQLKYSLLVVRGLLGHKRYPVEITVDGVKNQYDLNILAMGLGQTFGSGMQVLPEGRYQNTQMEIAIIHSASRLKFLWLFPKVFSGKHVHVKKHVTMLKGKEVKINLLDSDRFLHLEAEGEIFGTTPRKIQIVEKGLNVLTPKFWNIGNPSLKV